mmetsp:Transcript_28999/g.79575  ORF Transcript_28999/g.79575 Transcript_28999/m.79575 type:complete len:100 (-) Transcript_28999:202-501(-)|eukprot:CAMPEP_0168759562 /NCGR_PEP_ID=MMETSP0724-20121128/22296_1 /TAXON_ID=265536 /ORGANISM="Amphiprora sp., Strain CCMP467" /LENGTH=99 /DNA_ID=CAMNT_0008808507 /DNA_START=157 /DNA_END=456 /DNA_ORIENTATION=-
MHPPLDRPHPDCQDVILALKACHANPWKKFTGGCNQAKFALDHCFKQEKERQLAETNKNLVREKKEEQEIMKDIFGQKETFEEFLAKDPEYQRARQKST